MDFRMRKPDVLHMIHPFPIQRLDRKEKLFEKSHFQNRFELSPNLSQMQLSLKRGGSLSFRQVLLFTLFYYLSFDSSTFVMDVEIHGL